MAHAVADSLRAPQNGRARRSARADSTRWRCQMPTLVASGLRPDVEGGSLPPGSRTLALLRVVGFSAITVSNHFVRRAGCPALRQAGGPPLQGGAEGLLLKWRA